MKTRIYALILLLLTPYAAGATEAQVAKPKGRRPAVAEQTDPNQDLCKRVKVGGFAIIQNSVEEWNDEVVQITDLFEDCSMRVKLKDGSRAFIRRANLATSLALATPCADSHGTQLCVGDEVYYPMQAVTIGIPEGKLEGVFENGRVVVRDGLARVFDAGQVGKRVKCSPQKESICVDDYVLGNGYRQNTPFAFEGPVERVYSHGVVVVRSSAFWRFPIDVSAVVKRVATTENEVPGGVISSREVAEKVPARITPEVEPRDADALPLPRVNPAW
jgi:hypothetical protein